MRTPDAGSEPNDPRPPVETLRLVRSTTACSHGLPAGPVMVFEIAPSPPHARAEKPSEPAIQRRRGEGEEGIPERTPARSADPG